MRAHDVHGGVAHARGQHLRRPLGPPVPVPHEQQRPDQRTHHVVAEGVGAHGRGDDAVLAPHQAQLLQGADRGRALPLLAVRREVVLPQQPARRLVHGVDVQRPVVPEHVVPQQRVDAAGVVGDPVGVAAPDRREAGVEAARRLGDRPDPHVPRQPPGQPLEQLSPLLLPDLPRQVHVRDLAPRVHPGVGPPGHRQLVRPCGPGHHPQRVLDLPLDGPPPPGLLGPPGELRAVVRQIQPHPDEPGLHLVTHTQILSGPKRPPDERKRARPEGRTRSPRSSSLRRPSTPRRRPRRPAWRPRRPRRTWPRRPRPSSGRLP